MKFLDENGEVNEPKFRLASTKSANALYRILTEKHVFYSCEAVGESVATQCILGISGIIWSITPSLFKDNPETGKNFVFDIRRTLRQFYDDVQRTMFKMKVHLNSLTLERPALTMTDESSTNDLTLDGDPIDQVFFCVCSFQLFSLFFVFII
jgi:hypothetical protein